MGGNGQTPGVTQFFQDPNGLNGQNINGVPVTSILIDNADPRIQDTLGHSLRAIDPDDPSSFFRAQLLGLDSEPDRATRLQFGFNFFRTGQEFTGGTNPGNQRRVKVINGTTGELLANFHAGIRSVETENQEAINAINSVTLATPLDPFQTWAEEQGIPEAERTDEADPDGDRISNLLEYALGLNPTEQDSPSALPRVTSGPAAQFTFQRRQDNQVASTQIQMSSDLDFENNVSTPSGSLIQVDDLGDGLEQVTIDIPEDAPILFFRVVTTRDTQ